VSYLFFETMTPKKIIKITRKLEKEKEKEKNY
jgi:hypothetical protein